MGSNYKLVLRSPAGERIGESRAFSELAYRKEVNAPGLLTLRLHESHPFVDDLDEDAQLEVWRSNPGLGLDWYVDFRGLVTPASWETTGRGSYATVIAPGEMSLLGRRIIAYPAGRANSTDFTNQPAETVIKFLVAQNITTQATVANGRDRNGALPGKVIQVPSSQGRGNLVSWSGPRKSLLGELQRIARIAGGDFDLRKTGATQWSLDFYPGQLGVDRSSELVFSLNRGNMANPRLSYHSAEFDVAIVAGQGREEARAVRVRGTGDYEGLVDGRNDTTDAALDSRGDMALADAAARREMSFDVVQTPGAAYGLHYRLGDRVRVVYRDFSASLKVNAVTVSVPEGRPERIDIEMR